MWFFYLVFKFVMFMVELGGLCGIVGYLVMCVVLIFLCDVLGVIGVVVDFIFGKGFFWRRFGVFGV